MAVIFKLINFAVFTALLYALLRKPVKEFLSKRHISVGEVIASAKKAFEAARKEESSWSERAKGVEAEIKKITDDMRSDGELERGKIVEQAKRYAGQMVQDASSFVKNETSRVAQDIKRAAAKEMTELVMSGFSKQMTSAEQMKAAERAEREISESL